MANPAVIVQLSPGLREMIRKGPAAVVSAAVVAALDEQNEYTIGAAVQRRVSFPRTIPPTPEGLRVQTGGLRRSITRAPARVVSGGVISAIGSNLKYFAIHEFGWSGTQNVPQHTRKNPDRFRLDGGKTVNRATAARAGFLTKKGKLRKGLGETLEGGTSTVKAHSRNVRFPARAMVRTTLTERIPDYEQAIARRIVAAINGTA